MTSCQEFLALFYAVFGAHLAVHGVAVSLSQAEIVNARGGVCRGACTGSRRTFRDSLGGRHHRPVRSSVPPSSSLSSARLSTTWFTWRSSCLSLSDVLLSCNPLSGPKPLSEKEPFGSQLRAALKCHTLSGPRPFSEGIRSYSTTGARTGSSRTFSEQCRW